MPTAKIIISFFIKNDGKCVLLNVKSKEETNSLLLNV